MVTMHGWFLDFPSFSEGLSLRGQNYAQHRLRFTRFPFLFGGTFIEGSQTETSDMPPLRNFPSFSEGLSLRDRRQAGMR